MYAREKFLRLFDHYDHAIATWMERYGYRLLRISMGIVFIWFGALKPFGLSPAEALVAKATTWIPVPWSVGFRREPEERNVCMINEKY